MFTTDTTIVDLKIKERNLHKAIFSMNFHQVATPELGVDEARFYIFFFREGSKIAAYIALYMPHSERRLYYTYSSNPFPEADLSMVEDVARAFGEEMGFFLDEKSFASSSAAEKNAWIDEQPIFGNNLPEEHTDAVSATERTPAAAVDKSLNTKTETPPPPVSQPVAAAPIWPEAEQPASSTPPTAPVYYQPTPPAPQAQQPSAAPVYYHPAPPAPQIQQPPAAPVYYQPAPATPQTQPPPAAAPVYYQPAPQAQQPPAVPVYYQPAPPAPAAPQTPSRPRYHNEIELEPEVEVENSDVRPPRRKNSAAQRSSLEKGKTTEAASRTTRAVQANGPEEEPRHIQKDPAPALKQQGKKETRVAPGVVPREMEALARLMASF